MIESLSIIQVKEVLIAISKNVISKEKTLNDADRMIGDGDHGSAMARGFHAIIDVMEEREFNDLTEIFIAAGNSLLASVGGCAGIIFGTFFRSGGKALKDATQLDAYNFTDFMEAAFEAIQNRGKAKLGDKTMLDALHPAIEKAKATKNLPFPQFIRSVKEGAKEGMENTSNLMAETGRAKDFGKNALGFLDPGSITLFTIFESIDEYIS